MVERDGPEMQASAIQKLLHCITIFSCLINRAGSRPLNMKEERKQEVKNGQTRLDTR